MVLFKKESPFPHFHTIYNFAPVITAAHILITLLVPLRANMASKGKSHRKVLKLRD